MGEKIEREKLYARCTPEELLRGARAVASKMYLRNNPLWKLVSDVTRHGSGYSIAICEDLGWNPHAKALDPLPERRA